MTSIEPAVLQFVAPDERAHGEALYALIDAVWPGAADDCRQGRVADSHYDWATSRIGLLGDRALTHFGVYALELRAGVARLPTAGVNLVATHPDHRGRGLMAQTVEASHQAMAAHGYALALLCNAIPGYYGRFGYVFAWPEVGYTIKTEHLPAGPPRGELRAFTPGTRPDLAELYNRQHDTVTGTAVRPTFRHTKTPSSPGRGFFWTDTTGAVAGYVVVDATPDGKLLWHDDSGGDAEAQLVVLGHLAREWGCEALRVTRQPQRGPLARALRRRTCQEEAEYSETGGWMVRVVDAGALLRALAPELSRRLRRSGFAGWQGDVLVRHQGQPDRPVLLSLDGGEVRVAAAESGQPAEHVLDAGEALAQLAIGTWPPDELREAGRLSCSGRAGDLAEVLFPEQQPQLGNGDL